MNDTDRIDRDQKLELAYAALSVAAVIILIVTGQYTWASATFIFTLVTFGVWRIGRTKFR